MKSIKYSFLGLALTAMALSSCQNDYDAPELEIPVSTLTPNTTLAEFKEMLVNTLTAEGVDAVKVPQREDGSDFIIHGRVISSDASGNIYQSLVIQDETSALNLSIREGNMWSSYRVGQDVVINASNLYMGSYIGLYQLGWLDQNNGAAAITFMSWFRFQESSQKNNLPNQEIKYVKPDAEWPVENPYCIVANSISEINSLSPTGSGLNMMSQLVEFENVSFVDGGKETFAPYQESNVRRYITDASGAQIALNNSGYSTFYSDTLPTGTGNVRGILSYYSDAWQILIRDIDDVMFDDMPGYSKETALTIPEALAQENNGRTMWTQGYIVGSVKGGVSAVGSNDDIIWGADADLPTNLVIAPSANVKDWSQCMVVELGNNTGIRRYVNLVDNPEAYGKLLYVKGSLNMYLGMSGVTGADKDFDVVGLELGGADGIGTQESPYTVNYVIDSQLQETNVWVEGYIVGFVNGSDFYTDAVFGNDPASMTNYAGANVILCATPTGATTATSIPVRVLNRNEQGLVVVPENLGKKVKVQGNLGSYLNGFGVATTTAWLFE